MHHLGIPDTPQSGMCGTGNLRQNPTALGPPSICDELPQDLQVLPIEKGTPTYKKWAELSPLLTDWPQHQRTGISVQNIY